MTAERTVRLPRVAITVWTFTVLRRCYRGHRVWDVIERAVRMLATADGHLDAGGAIKRGRR